MPNIFSCQTGCDRFFWRPSLEYRHFSFDLWHFQIFHHLVHEKLCTQSGLILAPPLKIDVNFSTTCCCCEEMTQVTALSAICHFINKVTFQYYLAISPCFCSILSRIRFFLTKRRLRNKFHQVHQFFFASVIATRHCFLAFTTFTDCHTFTPRHKCTIVFACCASVNKWNVVFPSSFSQIVLTQTVCSTFIRDRRSNIGEMLFIKVGHKIKSAMAMYFAITHSSVSNAFMLK